MKFYITKYGTVMPYKCNLLSVMGCIKNFIPALKYREITQHARNNSVIFFNTRLPNSATILRKNSSNLPVPVFDKFTIYA